MNVLNGCASASRILVAVNRYASLPLATQGGVIGIRSAKYVFASAYVQYELEATPPTVASIALATLNLHDAPERIQG
jgi:hypothetical protein